MGKSFGCCNSSKQIVMSPARHAVESHSAVASPPHDEPKSGCSLLRAMGKFCGCYSPSGKPASSPPQEAVEASLEEIVCRINGTNPIEQIDPLTRCIEDQLRIIKATSEASTSSSSKWIQPETVSSGIDFGGQMVETISKEAEKLKKETIVKEMGKIAIDTLNGVAETHWMFIGLSVVGYVLRTYIRVKSNVSGCIELLEKLAELSNDLSKFNEAGLGGKQKLSKAVHAIIESAVMCLDYIKYGAASRYLLAATIEESLKKMTNNIQEIRGSLTLTVVIDLKRQVTVCLPSSPECPDFEPVGIEKQVQDVKELLNMEGSELALGLVLCGFGGVGKTTVASQAIYELNLPSRGFKYCKVTINEMQEKTSHIIKLQEQIIRDLGDKKFSLRDSIEGRRKIKELLGKQCCFLYIDNVVEGDYIEDLLTRDIDYENMLSQKLRIVITSRTGNLQPRLKIKKYEEYRLNVLSDEAANEILRRIILKGGNELVASKDFYEEGLMNDVAMACKGIPLLLSVYGNHLSINREKQKYEEVRDALRKGDLNSSVEEQLEQQLLFVYDKLKDINEEAQEAFLDICSYFQGWAWQTVSDIVGEKELKTLHNRMLINRSDQQKVIVHDILLLMGRKKAKTTRFLNSKDSFKVLKDPSKLQNVKGISLVDNKSLMRLKSSDLNAVHSSLRVLLIGNWINFDGPPCDIEFENLRYLHVGDINAFPFEDASSLKNLRFFSAQLKPGLCQANQLPSTLKGIDHDASQLEGVDAISEHTEGSKFPASLRYLRLCNFELALERLSHLKFTNLERLSLQSCTNLSSLPSGICSISSLEYVDLSGCTHLRKLPAEFGRLGALNSLVMEGCENLTELTENLEGLSSLELLDLVGCIKLQQLPESFGRLSALDCLLMKGCENLTVLPKNIDGLTSLRRLDLDSCIKMEQLPESFGRLSALGSLSMRGCENLTALPDSVDGLSFLELLYLDGCVKLQRLPESFGRLSALTSLSMKGCENLTALPENVDSLSSLQALVLDGCIKLERLPESYGRLSALISLTMRGCENLTALPENVDSLSSLQVLVLDRCIKLQRLPESYGRLSALDSLWMRDCENLIALPENVEGLSSLQLLNLLGCIKLQRLPESYGSLSALECLWMGGCENLTALPENVEGLSSLQELDLVGCIKLQRLPESYGRLSALESLWMEGCGNLTALPESMVGLSSLKRLHLKNCIKLQRLPERFGGIPLDSLILESLHSLEELPRSIGDLPYLKDLIILSCNSLTSLSDGIVQPKLLETFSIDQCTKLGGLPRNLGNNLGSFGKLKELWIISCPKLRTFPEVIGNMVTLQEVFLQDCEMMEGEALERIVKLQQCYYVDITGSSKLVERWKEMQQEEENCPLTVSTSTELDLYEWDRAATVGLFRGRCIQLDSNTDKLICQSSMIVAENTTVAVIKNHSLYLQRVVDKARERKLAACTEQLRIIYLSKVELDGQITINTEEEETIKEVLMKLPEGSCVIPSSESRRLLLIEHVLFDVSDKDVCFIANVRLDDQGRQILMDTMRIAEDEISGRKFSSAITEETKNVDDLTEYICSTNELDFTWQMFSKSLKTWNKKNNIEHDLDSRNGPVQMEKLEGKTVAIIMCDFKSCECMNLQYIYGYIKDMPVDFEAVWIPLMLKDKSYGYGSYMRVIQHMPWFSLPKPSFLSENENSRVILFDKEGRIFNQNALTTMIAWGANAYPFTDNKIRDITFNIQKKCSLEFLLCGMDFKNPGSIEVTESINNKVTLLYAEPPNEKLEMNVQIKHLIALYREIEILYVGNYFKMKEKDRDAAIKEYEDATKEMHWYALSFSDMVKFWYRCKYLLENEEQLNSNRTLQKLVQCLFTEEGWLVLFGTDGEIILSGIIEVEYMISQSNDKMTPR